MAIVYLGLGSNLGNRKEFISRALQELSASGIQIEKVSRTIETKPEGGFQQRDYFNAVLQAHTILSPTELFRRIKDIERKLGRKRTFVNAPRPIDIDILLYDRIHWRSPQMTIPHPRMWTRDFVMIPLKEIAPDFVRELQDENHSS